EIGIVQGAGRRGLGGQSETPLRFQLLDASAPIHVGQRIVTLGSQGQRPYVPGVPIGTVERIERSTGGLTRTAYVRPFVRFTSLDAVAAAVAPPKKDPRDAVLPPKPSPSTSPSPSPSESPRRDDPEARPSGSRSPSTEPNAGD